MPQLIPLVPGSLNRLVEQLQLVVGSPLHVLAPVLNLPQVGNKLVEVATLLLTVDEVLHLLGIVVGEGTPEVG